MARWGWIALSFYFFFFSFSKWTLFPMCEMCIFFGDLNLISWVRLVHSLKEIRSWFPCWGALCAIHLECVQCMFAFVIWTLLPLPFVPCYACVLLLSGSVKVSLDDYFFSLSHWRCYTWTLLFSMYFWHYMLM